MQRDTTALPSKEITMRNKEPKSNTIVFRAPRSVVAKLDALAESARRTRSDVLRLLVERAEEVR